MKFVEITSVSTLPRIVGVPEGSRLQHVRAERVAGLQRESRDLTVIAHRLTETLLCLADLVLDPGDRLAAHGRR